MSGGKRDEHVAKDSRFVIGQLREVELVEVQGLLNREWRGKNTPTNVLSFPAPRPGKNRSAPPYIGDIVIAYQTVAREAVAEGKPFNHHLAHLAVHGFLHLLGYDHENDRDAQTMERLERKILKRLAVPDPYAPT